MSDKFRIAQQEMRSGMVERDDEIDMILLASISKEHGFLFGDPGIGKSMIADALCELFDAEKFQYILNQNTDPDELFGMFSISQAKNDRMVRITKGKAPDANILFLDETFKCNSACLNMFLSLLNEGFIFNDGTRQKCPIRLCIGASNEIPSERKELGALWDRFLFRKYSKPVSSHNGLKRLMFGDVGIKFSQHISLAELDKAHEEAMAIPVPDDVIGATLDILQKLRNEGIDPGNRRCRKSVKAVRAAAWLRGASVASNDDLYVLKDILWDFGNDQDKVVNKIVLEVANPMAGRINELRDAAAEIISNGKIAGGNLAPTMTERERMPIVSEISGCCSKLSTISKELAGMGRADASSYADFIEKERVSLRDLIFA
ncbi:AAA family ATPase [Candidatus Kaiserbacteria bacterium]|nr:AAA family ATPase [Candidatus Kaiserbacteria bacterium]